MRRASAAPNLPSTPLRFTLHFVGAFRAWYLGMFVCQTLAAAAGIAVPYALGQITTWVTKGHGAAGTAGLRTPVVLFIALGLGDVLFTRLSGNLQFYVAPRLRARVTRDLYAYLQQHAHRYFSNNFAGSLAHRISETAAGVAQTLFAVLFDFWPIAVTLGVAVWLLARANGFLAGLVALWSAVFVVVSFLLARRCRPFAQQAAAARSVTTGKVVDAVTNLSTIRLFAREENELRYLDTFLDREIAAARTAHRRNESIRWFQHLSSLALKVATLMTALWLWRAGRVGVGAFVMSTGMSLLIITEARNLGRRFMELFEYVGNVANGVHVIVQAHEVTDEPDAAALVVKGGGIDLRAVTFGYAADRPIFRDLTVSLAPGERVGLVGYSGSGKSTFVNLILRLYDPQHGAVFIDGVDVRTVLQQSLHEQIGLIPQDPGLFHRTLRENIAYGSPQASLAAIEDAARRAHAHDFIGDMKDGYESLVGERGVKLSGGQRQRVALARVILKNAPILILDEATSSLDSVTERAIQESLDGLMQGKTVIVVAHRLSTIAHLDRILVFDNGQIVEDGTHAQLLARRGAYRRLWSRQADGFLPDREQTEPEPQGRELAAGSR